MCYSLGPWMGPRTPLQGYVRMYVGENFRWMAEVLGTFYQGHFIFRGVRGKGEFKCHLTPKWELVCVLN